MTSQVVWMHGDQTKTTSESSESIHTHCLDEEEGGGWWAEKGLEEKAYNFHLMINALLQGQGKGNENDTSSFQMINSHGYFSNKST